MQTESSSTPVSRNYAEALLALATKAENREGFGTMIRDVANVMQSDPTVRRFLESPRVAYESKNEVLAKALGDRVPRVFLRFLQMMVQNRRQMLIPSIANEYSTLLDAAEGRVHAEVTVASAIDDTQTREIEGSLARSLGKSVVAHVTVDPAIMGGVIVKVGDSVLDGSVRRRLGTLATRLRAQA